MSDQEMAVRRPPPSQVRRPVTSREYQARRNITINLERKHVANIPVCIAEGQLPDYDQRARDFRATRIERMSRSLSRSVTIMQKDKPLRRVLRWIDKRCRLPKDFHITSLKKHAKRRFEKTMALKPRFQNEEYEKMVFEKMEPVKEHPVRFIWWISLLQVIVFAWAMAGGGAANWGVGSEVTNHDVVVFNNIHETQSVQNSRNMWYGPSTATIVQYGAKFTPCMRSEPEFVDKFERRKAAEEAYGCCIDTSKHCGRMSQTNCEVNYASAWTNTTCAAQLAQGTCTEITLRPCCYYIHNECIVTSKQHCDVLPSPRLWHDSAELCSEVRCEKHSCGMRTLGSASGNTPNQWWRFFTPIFQHIGVGHLILNLSAQIMVGGDVESLAGPYVTAAMYLASGVAGNILAALMAPMVVSAGASSSIYGLIAIQTVDMLQSWRLIQHKKLQALRITFSTALVLGIGTLPWIDNWAHFGGYVVGAISALAFLPCVHLSKRHRLAKYLLTVQSRVVLVVVFVALLVAFYLVTDPDFCGWCKYIDCIPYTKDMCDDV